MIGGDPAFCCFDFVRKWYAVKHTMAKPATSSVSPCIVNTMLDQCCVRELFDTKQCGIGAKVLQQKENLTVFYKLASTRRSGGIKQRWQRRLLLAGITIHVWGWGSNKVAYSGRKSASANIRSLPKHGNGGGTASRMLQAVRLRSEAAWKIRHPAKWCRTVLSFTPTVCQTPFAPLSSKPQYSGLLSQLWLRTKSFLGSSACQIDRRCTH